MRFGIEKLGSALVVLVTIATLALLGVDLAFKMAGADLHAQVSILHAAQPPPSRSPLGHQLSAALASDVAPDDVSSLDARAFELDHRADRVLEAAAVVALVGMLVAFLSGGPASERTHARDASSPLANTSSNGTV